LSGKFTLGWRQVWLALILLSVGSMVTATFGILSVPLMTEFGPSRMTLMLPMSVIAAVMAVLGPPLGTLMDRISLRLTVVVGGVLLSAGYVALSYVTEFWQVLVVYGLFLGPSQLTVGNLAMTVLVSRWFSALRGRAMGISLTGVSVGGFVFPLVAQFLLDTFDWRTAVRVFAAILALIVFPCVLLMIDRPSDVGLHPDGADADPEHGDAEALAAAGLTNRQILSDPTFWILALILSVIFSAMRGVITNIAPMATDEGIDPTYIAYLVSIYSLAGVAAKLGYAAIADRSNPRKLLMVTMLGAAAAHLCLVFAESGFAMLATGALLIGFFGGTLLPMQGYLVPRIFGRGVVGRVSGLLGLALIVFNVASPALFGLIHDISGNYDAVFVTYIALTVGTMLLLPIMRVDPRQPRASCAKPDAGNLL
jgi:sugar phosphate permease